MKPDCSNVDSLPTLTINLGGHELELSPHLYVGLMELESSESLASLAADVSHEHDPLRGFRKRMMNLAADQASAPAQSKFSCVTLFMDMDMRSNLQGKPFILGIPFLRAYNVMFNRVDRSVGVAKMPVGSAYCTSCNITSIAPVLSSAPPAAAASMRPAGKTALWQTTLAAEDSEADAEPPQQARRVKMSLRQLRVPAWARHAHYEHAAAKAVAL